MPKPLTGVLGADLHYPVIDRPTVDCFFDFIERRKPRLLVLMGDQHDNQSISHHTKGKPGLRDKDEFLNDTEGFEREFLKPLERMLPKNCIKVWIKGNHDGWVDELYEEMPELNGMLDRHKQYRLKERGWKIVDEGCVWRWGKLYYLHGEILKTQNHAKYAVETFCRSVVYGHFHSPQSWTKVLAHDATQKWMAQCLPILGSTGPAYLKKRPTAWVNGFGVVEYQENGNFNLYPVVTTGGKAAYGGEIYG